MRQGEKHAGDGADNCAADARSQTDFCDEISGERSHSESDEVDEKERAQSGGGKRKGRGAQVEGDPGENADEGKEHIEADGECGPRLRPWGSQAATAAPPAREATPSATKLMRQLNRSARMPAEMRPTKP